MDATIIEQLCTIAEVCATEKICRTTVYKRITEGAYQAFKLGRATRITVASVTAHRKAFKTPNGGGDGRSL